MPAENIARNRKKFIQEVLDTGRGEKILGGSADGLVRIISQYQSFYEQENPKDPKEYHMSLFPTNKRIVVYQKGGFFHRDEFAQLPISEMSKITYCEINNKKKIACVTEFIAPDDSKYPSIVFKMDCSGNPDDLEQYKVILRGIARMVGIPIDDYTENGVGISSNIYIQKAPEEQMNFVPDMSSEIPDIDQLNKQINQI